MTTALEGGEGSASRPGHSLPPGKTRYPLYRRLGGPQGRCGQVRKISPPQGFDPRTVQPVASRYTVYATLLIMTLRISTYHLKHFLYGIFKNKSHLSQDTSHHYFSFDFTYLVQLIQHLRNLSFILWSAGISVTPLMLSEVFCVFL